MDRHTAGGRIDQFRLYLLAERGRSPHTAESYASDLRQWLQFCDGAGCPPYPPSPDDVAAFRRNLAAEGKARSTQQRAVAAIRSWMRFVEMEEGHLIYEAVLFRFFGTHIIVTVCILRNH